MPVVFKRVNGAALAAFVVCSLLFLGLAHADMLFKRGRLTIDTRHGPVMLDIEIADTERKREQGLMFRQHLAANEGMLFLFDTEEEIKMWMENTYIPLDMVFIGSDWRIVNIARDAEPLSTRIISSVQPASRVLEIAGGQAEKLGLKTGDGVTFQQ
jgi:uncharacterized membrane protein (UPF0127 family)